MESKLFKRVLSLAIVVFMVVSMLPMNVFAAALTDDKCPECEDHNGTWSALTATSGALTTGHYRLSANLTLTAALTVAADQVVCIDLAGYNITAPNKNNVRVFEIAAGGTLTVLDSSANETGVISGGIVYTNASDGKVYGGNIYNEGTFNLYGGTISNGRARAATKYQAQNWGGNIACMDGSVFNMYGGTLTGGNVYRTLLSTSVTSGGGNIYGKNATINLLGGTVTEGYCYESYSSSATARRVYSAGGNIYITGCELTVENATVSNGSIGGEGKTAKVTCTGGDVATYYARGGNIYSTGSNVTIKSGTVISGGVLAPTAITSTTAETNSGSANITALGGNIYINAGKLDIQGGTITGGSISGTVTKTTSAGSVSEGNINAYGGNLYVVDTEVTMTGGTISDGTCDYVSGIYDTSRGGNIYITYTDGKSSSFAMSGGTLSGGTSYDGANLWTNSVSTINGTAQILDGTSRSYGGNIYFYGSTHTIGGNALITDGESTASNAGNIYMTVGAKVTLADDAVISNGTAYDGGGNVFCNTNSQFYMTGGTIKDGVSLWEKEGTYWAGGNVEVFNGADMYIYDGVISGGTAKIYANSLVARSDANIFLYGGEIQGTDADNDLPLYANINKTEGYKLYAYNGKVAFDPTADLAECACAVDNGDGTWTVWHTGLTADGTVCTADNCSFLADEKVGTPHEGAHTYGEDYLCVYCGQMAVASVTDAEGNVTCYGDALEALVAANGDYRTVCVLQNASVKLTDTFTSSNPLKNMTISTAEGVTLSDTSGASGGRWYASNITFAANSNFKLKGNPTFVGTCHIYGNVDLYMATIKGTMTLHGDEGGFLRLERNLFLQGTMNVIGGNDGEQDIEGNYYSTSHQIAVGSADSTGTLNVTDATVKFDTIQVISGTVNLDNTAVTITELAYDNKEDAVIVVEGSINLTNGSSLVLEQETATVQVAEGQAITLDATSTMTATFAGLQNVGVVVAEGFDGCVWYENGTYAAKAHNANDATCTADGKCTNCNTVINEATGHTDPLTKYDAKDATCTEAGHKEYYYCAKCEVYFEDAAGETVIADLTAWQAENGDGYIAPLGHDYAEEWSKNDTHHWHACANDAEHKADYAEHVYVYANTGVGTCECGATKDCAHNWEVTGSTAGDCQTAGTTSYECSVCHMTKIETGAMGGHSLTKTEAKPDTCTEAGNSAYWTCSVCGKFFSDAEGVTEIQENDWIIDEITGHSYTYTSNGDKATHTIGCEKGDYTATGDCTDENGDKLCDFCGQKLTDPVVIVYTVDGSKEFESLQEAINASEEGCEYQLQKDIVLTERLTIDKNAYIKLNGFSITGNFDDAFGMVYVKKGAYVSFNNGTIENAGGIAIGNYGFVELGAEATVTGADAALYNFYYQADYYGIATVNGKANVIWNCGNLTVDESAVVDYLDNSGAATISGTVTELYAQDGSDCPDVEGAGTLAISNTENVSVPDDYKLVEVETGVYKVVAKAYVAEVNGTKYETLAEALAADGEVVLVADITVAATGVTIATTEIINLNGKTLTSTGDIFVVVAGGDLTIKGEGFVKAGTDNAGTASAVYVNGGKVTINGGTYSCGGDTETTDVKHQNDLIYVKGGNAEIYGGYFALTENVWALNISDSVGGTLKVYGGEFEGYDPAENVSRDNYLADQTKHTKKVGNVYSICENTHTSTYTEATFEADAYTTYTCVCGDTYTVTHEGTKKTAVAEVNGTKYETLAEALAADGEVKLIADITLTAPVIAVGEIIDLNGYTLSGNIAATLKLNGGNLITAEGYKMIGDEAEYYYSTDAVITIAPTTTLDITIHSGTLTLVPDLWYTTVGQTLIIEQAATFVIPEGKTMYVNGSTVTATGIIANYGTLLLAEGAHVKGDVAGTIKMAGGTFETSEYVMIGATEGKYLSTDAVFTILPTEFMDMVVSSGTITLNDPDWWTLAGQTLTIAEDATFVVPAGKNINVQGTVIVNGTAVVDGTVTLYNKTATVKAAANLNVVTGAGDTVIYEDGVYKVHDHEHTAVVTDPTCTEKGYTTYTCVCGDSYVADYVDETGHNYVGVDTPATGATNAYTTYTCDACGDSYVVEHEGTVLDFAINEQTGETYPTLQAALNAAAKGQTVKLLKDVTADDVYVGSGKILDLNGKKLTVNNALSASYTTTHIIDSSNGDGLLVVDPNAEIALNGSNEYLPVWTAEGVRFITASFKELVTVVDENTTTYQFYLNMNSNDTILDEILANGTDGTGLTIRIKVTYTGASGMKATQYFELTSDMVESYVQRWDSIAAKLTVTGTAGRSDLEYSAEIVSTAPNGTSVVVDKVDN